MEAQMKNNIFTYIFIVIAVGLIAFAVYYIYNNEQNSSSDVTNEIAEEQVEEITDIRLRTIKSR